MSDHLFCTPPLLLGLLLVPPLLWIGIVYVGSLIALLIQSFYSVDEFSGMVKSRVHAATYAELLRPANIDIIVRSVLMAAAVTIAAAFIAFPIAYYAARYATGAVKALFYLAVMMPLWSSYLVKVYAWKLILAKEGIVTWLAGQTGLWACSRLRLATPVIGGPSLSISYIGMFVVFVYIWLPYHDPARSGGARAGAAQHDRCFGRSRGDPVRPSAISCCRWRCPASRPDRSSPSR